jgi:two-component system, NtrC family, response regulator HydG
MRAADLDLRELLQFDAATGGIQFAGQRALLFDAVALGLLRKELIELLGHEGARNVLTRFGYAHGWRTAETVKDEFPWDNEGEWRRAGGRLHMLQGMANVEAPKVSLAPGPEPFAEAVWHDSYEAEQHLLHLGRSEDVVCWTLAGFASGYLSCSNGRDIYCLEDRCRGKGDAICHIAGRSCEQWGALLQQHLPYYRMDGVDAALTRVTGELRRVDQRLRARRKQLVVEGSGEVREVAGVIAQSEPMRKVIELARRVATADSAVLISGESGAGKERIARLIHDESTRAAGPFVAINCGALPETLLETELFGYVRGAFTGAVAERLGLFEAASGGTLFLDEIGEMPLPMQVKLLRVLQEGELRRVGEVKTRKVNVRIVAATHRDLVAEIAGARFRQDLYYRLRVIEIHVPPLRARRDDILPLARVFLAEAAVRTRRKVTSFTPAAANQLIRHDWPGNVRELSNAIERAVVLATGDRVELGDLPDELGQVAAPAQPALATATVAALAIDPGAPARSLAEVEREHILATLRSCGGNRLRAAAQLQIGAATLYRKLKLYGADVPGDAVEERGASSGEGI